MDASRPAPTGQQAAFFDFDKTLLHGDAGVIFGWTLLDYLVEQGKDLPLKEQQRHVRQVRAQAARLIGKGAVYRSLNAMGLLKRSKLIELTYRFLEGMPEQDMGARMERVWNEKLSQRLYPTMVEILERHRKEGRRIVIVTTGLAQLVEHSKKALGDDIEVIGVRMNARDGKWLGTVEGPLYGAHKAAAVREYAHKHGIDLHESWAYSDHYSDVAFLATVGHPVVVNPSLRLSLHARKKGWEVKWILPPPSMPTPPEDRVPE